LDGKRKKFFERWTLKKYFYHFKEDENRLESLPQEKMRRGEGQLEN
jgi:hypothetical protein